MLAFNIALRYLFSRKSHGAVNAISAVAVAGVAVAAAAMIIVLSVFNGFSKLCESKISKFAPPVMAAPVSGKVIIDADSIAARLGTLPEVAAALPVLSEQAFAIAGTNQMPVTLMGVTDGWVQQSGVGEITIDGAPTVLALRPGLSTALFSVGVAMGLQTYPQSPWGVEIYEPRRTGRYNPANPTTAFVADSVVCIGVFRVEQEEYDRNVMVVPISVSRRLLDYDSGEATGIAIWGASNVTDKALKAAVEQALKGEGSVHALDRLQQQPDLFRMIGVEKWITFAMLVFILLISAFNIVSTLSMMVLEKEPNMEVMRAMGAGESLVRRIFANQGWLITVAGGAIGLLIGTLLCLGQEHFGWVKLNALDPSMLSISAYPVATEISDIAVVAAVIFAASIIIAIIGALLPGRNNLKS